jgi:hypothetical protein
MRQKPRLAIRVVGFIVVAILSCLALAAQEANAPSLKGQLVAQYKLVRLGPDANGTNVLEPGTVLVVQKEGIFGVPNGTAAVCPSRYQDGNLVSLNSACGVAVKRSFRVGEKVYPSRIDVDLKQEKISLGIVACDACNGISPPTASKSEVAFQFAKGYLETASVPDVEDTIAQVFTLDDSGAAASASPPAGPGTEPTPAPSASATTCGDYESCFKSGVAALQASQLDSALSNFQAASSIDPSKPDPLAQQGQVYVTAGQYQDAVTMWDKALSLGGTLSLDVWHQRGLHREAGTFNMRAQEVSFVGPDKEKAFAVLPAEVAKLASAKLPLFHAWVFHMNVGGKKYYFFFLPLGARCEKPAFNCEEPGPSQMAAVARYVSETIPRLASGSFAETQ